MDPVTFVHSLFDAVEQNDSKKFDAHCAPDAVMWHVFRPNESQALSQTGKSLSRLHKALHGLKYAHRRYEKTESGNVVARHALSGKTVLGVSVEVHMIVYLTLKDGKIQRVEEAVDTGMLKPIYEAMQSLAA